MREGRGDAAASSSPLRYPGVRGRQAEAVTPEGHRLPGLQQHRAEQHSSLPRLNTKGKEREGKPGSSWLALARVSSSPPRFPFPSRGDPAVGPRVAFPGWRNPTLRPRPPLPAAFPLRFNYFLPEKKLISLPGRSEAINRLLYIIMFSYSSRLPLPSTDSL